MKHLIRLLAKLYPAPWREKYGAEFDQLLDDSGMSWRALFDVLRGGVAMQLSRGMWTRFALTGVVAGLLTSLATAYLIPVQWRAAETLTGGNPSSFRALWDQVTVATLQTVNRRSLSQLIERYNLYPDARASAPLENVIEDMRRHIRVEAQRPNVVSFSFEYPDRELATKVVASIVADVSAQAHLEPASSLGPTALRKSQWRGIAFTGVATGIITAFIAMWLGRRRVAKA